MTLLTDPQHTTPLKPIPTHKGHWLWGGTFDFQKQPADFVLEGHKRYGDIFKTRVLYGHSYFIRDPEIVNAINVTHAKHVYKPKIVKQMWKPFLGNGLVPNDGESWKRQHKLIMPAFHKLRIDAYASTMAAYTRDMLRGWKQGERRDFRKEVVDLALRVVAKTLFDTDVAGDCQTINDAMVDISEALIDHAQTPIPTPRWWPSERNRRMVRALDAMDDVIGRLVSARRKENEDRGDLMSHIVFATDERGGMSEKQMRDELMTLIFAGHETTAHTLTWAWYLLATNRDKLRKAQREIDEKMGGRAIDVDDLRGLPYLEMCLKESLRRLPAVWIYAREAQTDLRVADHLIPKGAILAISPLAIGRNEKYYDNPLEYRPERWTREFERELPRGAYVPFAAGPRVCLGKQFAMMEMRIVLGTLLQNIDINVLDGFEPDLLPELSLNPGERGMQMTVRFRDGAPVKAGDSPSSRPGPTIHAA
jgi:cytochrome P450